MGMARFFFHIRDGGNIIPDEEGLEVADLEAAKFEAEASALDMLREAIHAGDDVAHQVIEVADADGTAVMQVALQAMLARAMRQSAGTDGEG